MTRLTIRADVGTGAIAASPASRDVVLAGRSGLYVVNLLDPFALPRWLPQHNAWDVSSVQWCPNPRRPERLVTTSSQKVLVWNLELSSDRAVERVLQGHRRAVTDLAFSPFQPDELASSSIDTTVQLWDLRAPYADSTRFDDFSAGAIKVQFSKTNEHELASAHNNRVVLWDRRLANRPVASVAAHVGECNDLQFLANGKLLTCSTDRTIKLWNSVEDAEPELSIECDFPVLSVVPTPYELGAAVVPLRGGAHTVRLVNLARQTGARKLEDVAVKDGAYEHPAAVRSALFLRTDYSLSHYDLLTWCGDAHMREWKTTALLNLPHASSAAGCKDDAPPPLDAVPSFNTDAFDTVPHAATMQNHRRGVFDVPVFNKRKEQMHGIAPVDWISGVRVDRVESPSWPPREASHSGDTSRAGSARGGSPKNGARGASPGTVRRKEELSQEIVAVSQRFPKVHFEDINIWTGTCIAHLQGPWGANDDVVQIEAHVEVPPEYPYEPLSCVVVDPPKLEINGVLREACSELSRHGVPALEFCVRRLVGDPVSIEDALASGSEFEPPAISPLPFDDDDDDDEEVEIGVDFTEPAFDEGAEAAIAHAEEPKQGDQTGDVNGGVDGDVDVIDSTPVPKSCGAVWSITGKLVCFFNQKSTVRERGPLPLDKIFADDSSTESGDAPFASDSGEDLDDSEQMPNGRPIMNFTASLHSNLIPPTDHHHHHAHSDTRSTTTAAEPPSCKIVIKDFKHLWPCRPDLAEEYNMGAYGEPLEMALHNAEVARKYGRSEDEYTWRLLANYIKCEELRSSDPIASMVEATPTFDLASSDSSGFRELLPALTKQYSERGNLQMLAGLLSVLSALRTRRRVLSTAAAQLRPPTHDHATVLETNVETIFQLSAYGSGVPVAVRSKEDGLTSLVTRDYFQPQPSVFGGPVIGLEILDESLFEYFPIATDIVICKRVDLLSEYAHFHPRLERVRRQYARLLHIWGLDLKHAEVLKANVDDPLVRGYYASTHSSDIEEKFLTVQLNYRKCSLCESLIWKTFTNCTHCSHAMHSACARDWWKTEDYCPACGCDCKEYTYLP